MGLLPGLGPLPADLLAAQQLAQPFGAHSGQQTVFGEIGVQLADGPVGKRQPDVGRPFLGNLRDALQLLGADLRWATSRIGRALKVAKARLVELSHAAVSGVLVATHLACRGQDTQAVANQPDQLVALRHPLRQLAVMHFGV
jgi:hypothetical protein